MQNSNLWKYVLGSADIFRSSGGKDESACEENRLNSIITSGGVDYYKAMMDAVFDHLNGNGRLKLASYSKNPFSHLDGTK